MQPAARVGVQLVAAKAKVAGGNTDSIGRVQLVVRAEDIGPSDDEVTVFAGDKIAGKIKALKPYAEAVAKRERDERQAKRSRPAPGQAWRHAPAGPGAQRTHPKQNVWCPQKDTVQLLDAQLVVYARNEGQSQELVVGEPRDVFFVIPPAYQ